jgi:hypothetical protein
MYRKLMRNTTMALGILLLGSSLAMADGVQGIVRSIDKGMATVDFRVNAGEGWKDGTKVECEIKKNVMECRQAAAQSSAAPTTSSPSTAAVKPAPAPATPAPAPSTTAPAPTTSTPASK